MLQNSAFTPVCYTLLAPCKRPTTRPSAAQRRYLFKGLLLSGVSGALGSTLGFRSSWFNAWLTTGESRTPRLRGKTIPYRVPSTAAAASLSVLPGRRPPPHHPTQLMYDRLARRRHRPGLCRRQPRSTLRKTRRCPPTVASTSLPYRCALLGHPVSRHRPEQGGAAEAALLRTRPGVRRLQLGGPKRGLMSRADGDSGSRSFCPELAAPC